jgi:hypothetical protein
MQMNYRLRIRVLSHATFVIAAFFADSATAFADQSDGDKVSAFVEKQQVAVDKAKSRLLKAIDRRTQQINRSNADVVAKQFSLDRIAQERRAFENLDRLPSCDELLEPVFEFLSDHQKVHRRIQKDRQELVDTVTIRPNSLEAKKLAELDARLNAFLGNPDRFTANSKWKGRRWNDAGSLGLELEIHQRANNVFRGKLAQIGKFGRADTMKVDGLLDGNKISFHTTEMIRGDERHFHFVGYIINDRIFAQLNGINTERKPFVAWASFSREGATN